MEYDLPCASQACEYLDIKGTKNLVSRAHSHICKWCILKSHHMHVVSWFLFASKNFITTFKNLLLKIVAHNKLELSDFMNNYPQLLFIKSCNFQSSTPNLLEIGFLSFSFFLEKALKFEICFSSSHQFLCHDDSWWSITWDLWLW